MDIRLLGPVSAKAGSQPVNLGARQQRLVFAVLALEVNSLVAVERLIDLIWPDDPPPTARRVIHSLISRLRSTLARAGAVHHQVSLQGRGTGYTLAAEPSTVDAHRFSDMIARARNARIDQHRLALLDDALALWRGPALMGTAGEPTRALLCGHLEDARLVAAEDRLDTLLRLGRHHEVIDQATRLAGEHPHRSRFTAALMLALHQAGRTADSLAVYHQTRGRLADDLGLDPPAELQQLHTTILRQNGQATGFATQHPERPNRRWHGRLNYQPTRSFTGQSSDFTTEAATPVW